LLHRVEQNCVETGSGLGSHKLSGSGTTRAKGRGHESPFTGDPLRVQQIGVVFLATAVASHRAPGPPGSMAPRPAPHPRSLVVAEVWRKTFRQTWGRAKLDDGLVRESPSSRRNRVALQRVLPRPRCRYGVSLDSLISQLGRQERAPALQSANRLSRAIVGFMGSTT